MHKMATALILMSVAAFAQQKAKQTKPTTAVVPAPGMVSGRIFLITGGGDIKPARFAKLYLFYGGAILGMEDSAGMAFDKEYLKAMDAYRIELTENLKLNKIDSEAIECEKELLLYSTALVETLTWAKTENKTIQAIFADADEEGNFKIAAPPGRYVLVAHGRAGFNDAFWMNGWVTVKFGEETTVKMARPEKSCLHLPQ
jgi:hypothetical protein